MRSLFSVLILLLTVMTACGSTDTTPPRITEVLTPRVLNPRSAVRITAEDDSGIQRIRLYATGDVLLGESVTLPYLISPDTSRLPNLSRTEVYAEVQDGAGNLARSAPTPVQIGDEQAPALSYAAGFTYPASAVTTQALNTGRPLQPDVRPEGVKAPAAVRAVSALPALSTPQAGASAARVRAVEWGWLPITQAQGYNLYLAPEALAGYVRRKGIQAVKGDPLIRQAEFLADDKQYPQAFGLFTALTSSGESAFSNQAEALFLPEQEVVAPADGETLVDGRPILTWAPNSGTQVSGYLYFVYTRNPEVERSAPVWSSLNGQSTAGTSAVYPATQDALPAGVYYWRVAAVSFSGQGSANGFGYSRVRQFRVK